MRVIVFVKGDNTSEAGVLPDEKLVADMNKYNEELVKAGVMLAAEGLYPSSKGVRVKFSGGKTTIIDGPFAEAKELVVGYWIWQVRSLEEAIEWAKRIPGPSGEAAQTEGVIEIRPIFEAEDFGANYSPELLEQEQRLRTQLEANAKR